MWNQKLKGNNTFILAICQGLFTCAISVDLTLTGLTGYQLAEDKAWATLPFALITVAGAIVTIAASFIMERIGRRGGFALGASLCVIGGMVSVWAVLHENFAVFCIGTAAVGIFQAFAQYYRLAAADSVLPNQKGKAISTVLTGGVIAAIAGPAIAAWSKDMIPSALFAGSYLMVAVFGFLSVILLLAFYREAVPASDVQQSTSVPPRPLWDIVRQPIFIVSAVNSVVGWVVMMFVMTAAPLAAVAHHHTIDDGAHIIEWHLVGMYAPSLFSGYLINKIGVSRVLLIGMGLNVACGLVAISSTDLIAFYASLLFLGIGWNFMFVGGSTLLSQSYLPNERAKTQGLAELIRCTPTAIATLLAGRWLQDHGWVGINMIVFPAIGICFILTIWWVVSARMNRVVAAQ